MNAQTHDPNFKFLLLERLEFPKAILSLLKETGLFNEMVEKAIDDLNEVTKLLDENNNHHEKEQ